MARGTTMHRSNCHHSVTPFGDTGLMLAQPVSPSTSLEMLSMTQVDMAEANLEKHSVRCTKWCMHGTAITPFIPQNWKAYFRGLGAVMRPLCGLNLPPLLVYSPKPYDRSP
uniref:Uncharacterized protein n=1 Tax=Eutreptiella gymnastica TaxID=73025 RepID=A0A7S4G5Z0_9EUGL